MQNYHLCDELYIFMSMPWQQKQALEMGVVFLHHPFKMDANTQSTRKGDTHKIKLLMKNLSRKTVPIYDTKKLRLQAIF